MFWRAILFIWRIKGWLVFLAACAGVVYYGPKKMMETWRWYKDNFYDWRYGKFRPTRKEINQMTSEKYREYWHDPKFRKWVDHLFPRSDEPPVDGPGRM